MRQPGILTSHCECIIVNVSFKNAGFSLEYGRTKSLDMKTDCRLSIGKRLLVRISFTGDAAFYSKRIGDETVFMFLDDYLDMFHGAYTFNATSLAAANPISADAFFICFSSFLIFIKWPGLNGSDG